MFTVTLPPQRIDGFTATERNGRWMTLEGFPLAQPSKASGRHCRKERDTPMNDWMFRNRERMEVKVMTELCVGACACSFERHVPGIQHSTRTKIVAEGTGFKSLLTEERHQLRERGLSLVEVPEANFTQNTLDAAQRVLCTAQNSQRKTLRIQYDQTQID